MSLLDQASLRPMSPARFLESDSDAPGGMWGSHRQCDIEDAACLPSFLSVLTCPLPVCPLRVMVPIGQCRQTTLEVGSGESSLHPPRRGTTELGRSVGQETPNLRLGPSACAQRKIYQGRVVGHVSVWE